MSDEKTRQSREARRVRRASRRGALPASIAAAWGVRERPGKGPRPGLSVERIVAAAIEIAASEGLAAVSMSRVASELGTGAMSLYRYVATKDELLALMVDTAHGLPPAASREGESWRAGLSRWAWAEHEAYRRHPWVLRIPISGPPITPNAVAWLEQGLRSLRETGLSEGEKMSVVLLLTTYVRAEATLDAEIAAAFRAAGATSQEAMTGYGQLLATLTDPTRFPALHQVIASGVLDAADPPDAEFTFGLERILDGVEALVRKRA